MAGVLEWGLLLQDVESAGETIPVLAPREEGSVLQGNHGTGRQSYDRDRYELRCLLVGLPFTSLHSFQPDTGGSDK